MEPSSITDSKQAYLAAIAAPTFQEGGDDGVLGVWPVVSFSGSRFAERGSRGGTLVFLRIYILIGDGCCQVGTTRFANFFMDATWLILPLRNLILPTFLTASRKAQGVKGSSKTRTPNW